MALEDDLAVGGMSKPPVNPPQLPTLSAIPHRALGAEGAGGPMKGMAILKLFHEVDMRLDTIASTAPDQSEALDQIKTRLRDVMTAIVNRGAVDDKGSTLPIANPSDRTL